MKILVVEDDPIALLVLESSLRALGHEPISAADGTAAWACLVDRSLRVVISDWHMPGIDGLELCRHIRARGGDYVSFVLLTQSAPDEANTDAAVAAGVDDFLVKPVRIGELKIRLHAIDRLARLDTQVRQLESFLPICAHCRKVRDDKNYWQQIEGYINTRLGTTFSHGICPSCYESVMVPQLRALGIEPVPLPETPPPASGPRVTSSGPVPRPPA